MRLESFYLVWLEVFNEIKTLVNFLELKNSCQFLFSIILFFWFIYSQAFFMQHMVWWDILKAQSWCISPTVVVRLGKEYIYIWVCKCNRTWDMWHFFFSFFFFSFSFLLIMILKFVNIWFGKILCKLITFGCFSLE